MHSDARSLPDGTEINTDLCIIGAGAAGISIAQEFANTKYEVTLLEAGGFEQEPAVQSLYKGMNTGLPYFPLHSARLRYFGGTTNHWSGWCSILDPIDFKERDWVPLSGWPLTLEDLKPFYRRAHPLCDLGRFSYNLDYWKEESEEFSGFNFEGPSLTTKVFKWSAPTRFGEKYRSEIVEAENITLWTHANVTEIETEETGKRATGLQIQCLNGKEHHAKARRYVLACGGLENPRLLLNSNRRRSNGIGNENELVGRYFMEHPHIVSAKLELTEWPSPAYLGGTREGGSPFALLALSEQEQRSHRTLNYAAFLEPEKYDRSLPKWLYQVPNVRGLEYYARSYLGDPPTLRVSSRIEQRPNPNSRVLLDSETDSLGQPKIKLNWSLTEDEKRTISVANQTIGEVLGQRGLGRLQVMDWATDSVDSWPDSLRGGWHHMGTTRMSKSPQRGVVDPNCKIHSVENLYVAGSSVYPTSGTANPTLTLVALALRLSDHLKEQLS
jgi:choline dehydrogenase-like flavoprotein